ncbi:MAG: tripartite tricarboxylate transporter substrate binding protein [Betaproteobacteria bacterium]|nr:tripartite tricarboxylate transporter substrate binding protein [Betaproteobacteria bacterium]
MQRIAIWLRVAVALTVCNVSNAFGSEPAYPQRPIRLVIPQSPGGASDTIGRLVAHKLTQQLGRQLVADNRPGATGNIGAELVAHATPDGYSLLLTGPNLVTSTSLYARVGYDPIKDFAPVTRLARSPNVWLVHPSFPAHDLKALIQIAKGKPKEISFSSSGLASSQHLAGELLNVLAGIELVHVPYKGGGPALIDLMAGRVPVMVSSLPSAVPQIKAGKVRALAVTTTKRSSAIPEVPTVMEATGLASYEASTWQGFVFPVATPRPIVQRVADETIKALGLADVRERLRDLGYEPVASTPAEFAAFITSEIARWAKVISSAGIKRQ